MPQTAKRGRILIIEPNALTSRYAMMYLKVHYELRHVPEICERTMQEIDDFDPEVVLVDCDVDADAGLTLCKKVRELDVINGNYTGIIVMVADGDSPYIKSGAQVGADCFCMKQHIEAQLAAVISTVLRIRDITATLRTYSEQLLASNQELENLVITDELTGLYNMRYVKKRLHEEFTLAQEMGTEISALMIDIDHFKEVNDGADHLLGSYVIGEVGREICRVTRRVDIPGRYGGDEFIVILPTTGVTGSLTVAERLHERIMNRVYNNGVDAAQITVSQGIATYHGGSDPGMTAEALMRQADLALYHSKANGRNDISVYQSGMAKKKNHSKKKKAS